MYLLPWRRGAERQVNEAAENLPLMNSFRASPLDDSSSLMRFEDHVEDWEELAKAPFSAILTGRRDWNLEDFFSTGKADAERLFAAAARFGLPRERARALDFGCGVGRITGRLAEHFRESWGVDVSAQMLRLAEEYNPSCRFHLSQRSDLRDFPDSHFDLVYSVLVLQHQLSRAVIESYLAEFVRVLRPEGLLAFHLPSKLPLRYRLAPRRRAYRLLRSLGISPHRLRCWKLSPMKMTAIPSDRVTCCIHSSGGRLLLAEPHHGSGSIPSLMYYCTKD